MLMFFSPCESFGQSTVRNSDNISKLIKLVKQGKTRPQNNTGNRFNNNDEATKDLAQKITWFKYKKMAEQGDEDAKKQLNELLP